MPDRYLGQTLGKYRVTRLLGAGAYAWVYEAIDQDLEIPVALKILRPAFAGQDGSDDRFRREAATAARLRHRNIVTVRDVGHADGAAFVVMDLYPLTLGRRLVAAGRLPETECIRIGLDVAAALAVAHAGGVVHRDIKPDNILLSREGDAVVADFGLARALAGDAARSATTGIHGTPHYFSPEQARGHEVDGRSDLYSLGVTLYRAATGHLPFEGEDWYAVARQHIETVPTPPRVHVPELTPAFESVVLRLLAKAPEHRYPTATQLLDALSALPTAPASPLFARPLAASTIDAFPAPPARHRWRTGGRAAAVTVPALVAALVAAVWWYGRSPRPRARPPAVSAAVAPSTDSTTTTAPPGAAGSRRPPPSPPPVPRDTGVERPARADTAITPPTGARLVVLAPDSARLYVDNRPAGRGRWTGAFPVGARVALRAVLATATTDCDAAVHDTTVLLATRGRTTIRLPVRDCVAVRYDVTPRDARVVFTPLDGGRSIERRADSARALSLPEGRYQVRIQAPRCVTGTDTITVAPTADGTPITRRFPLICS